MNIDAIVTTLVTDLIDEVSTFFLFCLNWCVVMFSKIKNWLMKMLTIKGLELEEVKEGGNSFACHVNWVIDTCKIDVDYYG